jgi:hypothetical protein
MKLNRKRDKNSILKCDYQARLKSYYMLDFKGTTFVGVLIEANLANFYDAAKTE